MCVDNAGSSKYRFSPNTSVVGRVALFPRDDSLRDLVGLDPSFKGGKDWLYVLLRSWIFSGTNEVGTIDHQIMQKDRLMTLSEYRLLVSVLSKEPITQVRSPKAATNADGKT